MDFEWSDDQKELRHAAEQFAGKRLNDDLERRDSKGEFSHEAWRRCAEFGVQGLLVQAEHGGSDTTPLDVVAILEGLGLGCRDGGLLVSLHAHMWGCQSSIVRFGTDEQRSKYLPAMVRGEMIGAHAMTETGSGSDVFRLESRAVKHGDRYVLNGVKAFVTNAPVADLFVVYARTAEGTGMPGISCFIVEKDTEGLRIGGAYGKMGLRTSPMAEVILEDCCVPEANLLGPKGSGSMVFTDGMEWERTFVMSTVIGSLERQICACIEYKNGRKIGGIPIGEHQAVGSKIVDMARRLESGRWQA